jgi:hypothetical protein
MDEHGIAFGVSTNSYVLGSSKKKRSYVETPESRERLDVAILARLMAGPQILRDCLGLRPCLNQKQGLETTSGVFFLWMAMAAILPSISSALEAK